MLHVSDLYPHLSEDVIKANEKFNKTYKIPEPTDSDKLYIQKINTEFDVICPVLSTELS